MKHLKLYAAAFFLLFVGIKASADEGMWLLQMMQEQHLQDEMKKQGLEISADEIYSSNHVSLKDAVGIFGGGCTGEIISGKGLILTNHHCGYGAIQQHSSVEHNYLRDGFWAMSEAEELSTPDLKFTFIDKIVDVTEIINKKIKDGVFTETQSFTGQVLAKVAKELLNKSEYKDKVGIEALIRPFFAGNKFYLFYEKVYTDVRMVAAPPSSVGKFGGETDNWMWPRHTGDFSMFRIYADKEGNPAKYNKDNVPLKTPKHYAISLKGVKDGDFAMVMGFPGSTNRFLTAAEIESMMKNENDPRIKVRTIRQNAMMSEMKKDEAVRIQYATKYAHSSNYWKNAIGMNKAIVRNKVVERKLAQEKRFEKFTTESENKEYKDIISKIDTYISKKAESRYRFTVFAELMLRGIELAAPTNQLKALAKAKKEKNDSLVEVTKKRIQATFDRIHNKDFNLVVDKKIAQALLPFYTTLVDKEYLPSIYSYIDKEYKGNIHAFIDDMYDHSIFSNQANLTKFMKKPKMKKIKKDALCNYMNSVMNSYEKIVGDYYKDNDELQLLHKTYVRGLCKMNANKPQYPDANFTIRLTYGNVKSYGPKDGIHFKYYTTGQGILEKEDPKNREFNVPKKLKELLLKSDFGMYAAKDGSLPVCFTTTNDITGGNSGSPVLNNKGELIGAAFDGNWESLSGDIDFDKSKQRCINVDIRYVLFIIDKLGNNHRLIEEMTIVK